MYRPLLALLGTAATLWAHGQAARLVFNNTAASAGQHPFVVFNSASNAGTYLVIDNPATTGITQLGVTTAPVIKSGREENKIRWATGATTGTYVIPFSTASGVAMPLTVNKTSAGTGAGSLIFSTWNSLSVGTPVTSGWNNDLYRPTDVTHMHDEPTGLANNSKNAIDRFWVIDAGEGSYAYSAKPNVNITFAFDPLETQANSDAFGSNDPGLLSTAGQLVAQRFNPGIGKWHDILPMGGQAGNTVAGTAPAPADFFRSWTLSNMTMPLPITLVAWNGACDGKSVLLKWTTASEQDNDHFSIEKSRDANDWYVIGTAPGAGNSSSMISYSFVDKDAQGLAYYRLRQTDHNGTSEVSHNIATGCGTDNGTEIVSAWDDGRDVNVVVSSSLDAVYDLTLMDAQGKVLAVRPAQMINAGITTLRVAKQGIAPGAYVVRLLNNAHMMSRRAHIH